ncbi:hypothetical protein C6W93_13095 [Mycobacterium kansasii]|nr:hypothetical protein [Mycobacterium kansasii]
MSGQSATIAVAVAAAAKAWLRD